MSQHSIRWHLVRTGLACLFTATVALVGCDDDRSNAKALDVAVQHVQKSNIATWANGRSGTNRWVGEPNARMPVIDVVVPQPRTAQEARIANAVHDAIVGINRKMAGLLQLRDLNDHSNHSHGHIEVSYLTAYVPPATLDDRAYCANASDAPGQAAHVRPGPDGRRDEGIAWLNLGNGHCTVTSDQVVHQLATALGLDAPFPGFDPHGPAVSEALWDALATLYANPVQTAADRLSPRRIDPAADGLSGQAVAGRAAAPDSDLTSGYLSGP